MNQKYIDKIILGECEKELGNIEDKSIDCILTDLPYGTTALNWDKCIDMNILWEQYERVIKDDGVIALFAAQPFTAMLITSNLNLYRYSWIWEKESPTGFLNASYAPLKKTEDICIFSKGKVGSLSKNPIRYYPQGVIEINQTKRNNPNSNWRKNKGYNSMNNKLNSDLPYVQKYTNYPINILKFARDKNAIHPTQKPVKLLEYLIRTYTKEGEVVLDSCSGSGSTAIACLNTNRKYICIEKDEEIWKKSIERVKEKREWN